MIYKYSEIVLNLNRNAIFKFNSNFIPKHKPVKLSDVKTLENFIKENKKILVLTGIWYTKSMIKFL